MPGPSEIQIDNLLRFLNDVETVDDLICGFPAELSEQLAEGAKAIMALREETGAFFSMADLAPLDEILAELMPALLDAARHPLLPTPPPERFALLSFAAAPMLVAGLVATPILFAIKWEPTPGHWRRTYPTLYLGLDAKRVDLAVREVELEARIKALKKKIDDETDKRDKALNENPPDYTVANQSEILVAGAKDDLATAEKLLKKVLRDAEALNKAVKAGDRKKVGAIVRTNLLADLKKKKAVERDAQTDLVNAPTPAEQDKAKDKLTEAQADVKAAEDRIKDLDAELAKNP